MKGIKVGFGVLAVAIFVSWVSLGTAHAQAPGFTDWQGAWLKLNTNFKGYERNLAGPPDWFTLNERFTLFLNITTWNTDGDPNTLNESFSADAYYYDEVLGWQSVPLILHYLHGSPLDFLIWVLNDAGSFPSGDGERLTFAARISGKKDRTNTFLQTASFKCLGGYFIEIDTDPFDTIYGASGVTMTGGLVPATFCNSTRNSEYPPCWQPR